MHLLIVFARTLDKYWAMSSDDFRMQVQVMISLELLAANSDSETSDVFFLPGHHVYVAKVIEVLEPPVKKLIVVQKLMEVVAINRLTVLRLDLVSTHVNVEKVGLVMEYTVTHQLLVSTIPTVIRMLFVCLQHLTSTYVAVRKVTMAMVRTAYSMTCALLTMEDVTLMLNAQLWLLV
jgi:hypothetical protein